MTKFSDEVLEAVSEALPIVERVAAALAPETAEAINTGIKIAQGVAAGVKEAEVLYVQFQTGEIPSKEELDAYATAEDGAYNRLMIDIAARLAANPGT